MDLNQEWMSSIKSSNDYHFDIFFIHKTNSDSRTWVRNACRILERTNIVGGYHERDSVPGLSKYESVKQCLNHANHFGVLITQDFSRDKFCIYEMSMALGIIFDSNESEKRHIIPLVFSSEEDVPDELKQFNCLDVSGPDDQWCDKLISAIQDPSPDDTRKLTYLYLKLTEAFNDTSLESAMQFLSILDKRPLNSVQQQFGLHFTKQMVLNSVGIRCTPKSLQIDFAKLLPNEVGNTKLNVLCSVFNQMCCDQSFHAWLALTEKTVVSFTSESDIKFYGIKGFDHFKLSLAFHKHQEISFNHDAQTVLSISHHNINSTLRFLSESQCSVQLRSKKSKHIRLRFPPYKIKRHSTRNSRHYRNYRKVRFTFPGDKIYGRYTYHRDSFRSCKGQLPAKIGNDNFLLVQKLNENQSLVF